MIRVIYLGTCYSNEIMKARHPKAGSKGNGWVLVTFLLSKNVLYIFILIFGTSIYRSNIIVASRKPWLVKMMQHILPTKVPCFFCHSFRIKKNPNQCYMLLLNAINLQMFELSTYKIYYNCGISCE